MLKIIKTTKSKNENKSIRKIYFHRFDPASDTTYNEYLIDFNNLKLYSYTFKDNSLKQRNVKSKNFGYDFVKKLNKEKVNTFLKKIEKLKLNELKCFYSNSSQKEGGSEWELTISYNNSEIKKSGGYNNVPDNWNDIGFAFLDLADIDVLGIE